MEYILILGLLMPALLILGLILLVRSRRRAGSAVAGPAPTPQHLEALVVNLVREHRKIEAIKELRRHTGLGLADAKGVVDAMAAGQPLWNHPMMARFRPAGGAPLPSAPQDLPPDLATRVRRLKAAGRGEQAVHLVRGETGMEDREARLFVEAL
jgi:hypothetical protein